MKSLNKSLPWLIKTQIMTGAKVACFVATFVGVARAGDYDLPATIPKVTLWEKNANSAMQTAQKIADHTLDLTKNINGKIVAVSQLQAILDSKPMYPGRKIQLQNQLTQAATILEQASKAVGSALPLANKAVSSFSAADQAFLKALRDFKTLDQKNADLDSAAGMIAFKAGADSMQKAMGLDEAAGNFVNQARDLLVEVGTELGVGVGEWF